MAGVNVKFRMLALGEIELVGPNPHKAAVRNCVHDHAQRAMIVISKSDEAERLQYPIASHAHGIQHLRHALHRAGLRLKSNFNKVTLAQGFGKAQQAARYRDRLKLTFCAVAVFKGNQS